MLKELEPFADITGYRDSEMFSLRWEREVEIPELNALVFIVPGSFFRSGDERPVALNDIARSVVASCRGNHASNVFAYKGKPITRMLNSSWCRVRKAVDLLVVRVHDLKDTFGRRLRAAGVSFEDRQILSGHRSERMATHYSAAGLTKLIDAANRVNERDGNKPELVVLRRLCVS